MQNYSELLCCRSVVHISKMMKILGNFKDSHAQKVPPHRNRIDPDDEVGRRHHHHHHPYIDIIDPHKD